MTVGRQTNLGIAMLILEDEQGRPGWRSSVGAAFISSAAGPTADQQCLLCWVLEYCSMASWKKIKKTTKHSPPIAPRGPTKKSTT
jgi:hypothetical protein